MPSILITIFLNTKMQTLSIYRKNSNKNIIKDISKETLNLEKQLQYNNKKCQQLFCLSKMYQNKIIKYYADELIITR